MRVTRVTARGTAVTGPAVTGTARRPASRLVSVVAAVIGAVAVVVLLAGCIESPERGDSRPQRLPLGIPIRVIANCEQSVGLGGSAPVTVIWRDSEGLHVRIGHGRAPSSGGSGGGKSATEAALLSCLTVVLGSQPSYPIDAAGLLLQWKYSTTVLWPCYAAHDADLGPVPSRAEFLRGDPLRIDPLYLLKSPITDVQTLQLERDCPLVPGYLALPTLTPAPVPTVRG